MKIFEKDEHRIIWGDAIDVLTREILVIYQTKYSLKAQLFGRNPE
jgi:hypothetical protein